MYKNKNRIALLILLTMFFSFIPVDIVKATDTGYTLTINHDLSDTDYTKATGDGGVIPGKNLFTSTDFKEIDANTYEVSIDNEKSHYYHIRYYWDQVKKEDLILKEIVIRHGAQTKTVEIPFDAPEGKKQKIQCAPDLSLDGTLTVDIRPNLAQVGFLIKKVSPTADIVVDYIWGKPVDPNAAKFKPIVEDCENGSIETRFLENDGEGSKWKLYPTPDDGYMLDYWEYSTDGGETYLEENRIVNDDDNTVAKPTTVKIREDLTYRAVFKKAEILLPDFINLFDLNEETSVTIISTFLNSTHKAWHSGTRYFTPCDVREGQTAYINFRYNVPSPINVRNMKFELYAGNEASGDPFETYEFTVGSAMVGRQGQILKPLPADPNWGNVFAKIDEIPYLGPEQEITMVATFEGGDDNPTYYGKRTIKVDGSVIKDELKEQRPEKLKELDKYYQENFAEKILEEKNIESGHNKTEPIKKDGSYAQYDSFSAVRILLRYAYEDYVNEIRWEASTEEDLNEIMAKAKARFEEYKELNNKILAGDGEAYKDVDGVIKVGFHHNVNDKNIPSFAYVPKDVKVRDAIQAAMENYNPRNWTIDGQYFITSMDMQKGDGYIKKGGYSSQIVYSLNHAWANGVAAQDLVDRDLLVFGNTIRPNQYPTMDELPNKDELIWALATLAEKYELDKLKENKAFENAMKLTLHWGVNVEGSEGIPQFPVDLASAQRAVDEALAKLQEEYPEDNLIRLDLPEEVLKVMKLINDIGNVTPASKDKIENARSAYDKLNDENKELVPNYETLLAAEEAYKLLEENNNEDYKEVLSSSLKNLKESYSKNPAIGSMGGEWSILGLARSGYLDSDIESKYLGQLNATLLEKGIDGIGGSKYTEYSRIVLALSSLGIDAENYTYAGKNYNFISKLLEYDNVVKQGINGPIFALLALDSKPYMPGNTEIRDDYIDYILARQHNDGGWSLEDIKTEPSDPDMTAMVLQALANYRGVSRVDNAIDKGLKALKSMQDETHGGFYNSYGDYNSESASQVIVALTSLGIDPTEDKEWTLENGKNPVTAQLNFYNSESSMFKHLLNGSPDIMATEQATYALVALDRLNKGSNSLYDMSDAFTHGDIVNKAGLGDIISLAQRLKEDDYTAESWKELEFKLEKAINLRDNSEVKEEEVNKAREELLEVIGKLEAKEVNESLLDSAIAIAEGLNENNYKNWREVSELLENIENLKVEENQKKIDKYAKDLIGALNSLELAPDKELLQAVLDKSAGLQEKNYKEDSWEEYTNAKENAENLIKEANDEENQNSIDDAARNLISSIANLELKEGEGKTKIQEVLESIKDDLNEEKYTKDSWSKLEKAKTIEDLEKSLIGLETKNELDYGVLELVIEQADKLNKEDYTEKSYKDLEDALSVKLKLDQTSYINQSEIDEDISRILTAMQDLERSNNKEERNKVLLRDLIRYVDSLQESRYSDETWEKLLDENALAKDVYKNPEASEESIESAKNNLLQAIGSLENITSEVVVDKSELSKQVKEASEISSTGKGYTTSSWKSFKDALKYAREILEKNDASQEEINNASRDLRNAINGLTEYEDDGSGGELPGEPIGKYATISVIDPNAKAGQTRTYFPKTRLEIRQGETAYSLLQRTGLDLRVSNHPVYDGVYVEAINGFGEFDDGPLSGWMYKVNGRTPNYSASLYELEDGDIVEWVYTRDLGKDIDDTWDDNNTENELGGNLNIKDEKAYLSINLDDIRKVINKLSDEEEVVIHPDIDKSIRSLKVDFTKSSISELVSKTNLPLVVSSNIGKVSIPNKTLEKMVKNLNSNNLSVIIEKLDKNDIRNNEVLETDNIYKIMIFDGKNEISNLLDEEILINLPYKLEKGKSVDQLKVWYIEKDNTLKEVNKEYNIENEVVSFKTDLKSIYIIGLRDNITMDFKDVDSNNWFYDDVKKLVKKGISKGVSDDLFAPNAPVTRATIATMIHRIEGEEISKSKNIFDDVKNNKWYTNSIIWAKDKGIVKGYGKNIFGPDDNLTREQASLILYRYAKYKGYDVSYEESLIDLSNYKDSSEISSWASDAMSWMVANKIIIGKPNNRLGAKDSITRAEIATILTRFMELDQN